MKANEHQKAADQSGTCVLSREAQVLARLETSVELGNLTHVTAPGSLSPLKSWHWQWSGRTRGHLLTHTQHPSAAFYLKV